MLTLLISRILKTPTKWKKNHKVPLLEVLEVSQKNANVLEKAHRVPLFHVVEVVLNPNPSPANPKVSLNFARDKTKPNLDKSNNKSHSKSKSHSKKSKSKSNSRSRSSVSHENQRFDAKNSSPYKYIKHFKLLLYDSNRRYPNRRPYDVDNMGPNSWDKERRGNFYMGRGGDRPYYKRRDDIRFNKYSKRHDDSRSRSSSEENIEMIIVLILILSRRTWIQKQEKQKPKTDFCATFGWSLGFISRVYGVSGYEFLQKKKNIKDFFPFSLIMSIVTKLKSFMIDIKRIGKENKWRFFSVNIRLKNGSWRSMTLFYQRD
jgi:hypothetical protein